MKNEKYFTEKIRTSQLVSKENPYGVYVKRVSLTFWRNFDPERAKSTGVNGFLLAQEHGPTVDPQYVRLDAMNFAKYFVPEYSWSDFLKDLTECAHEFLEQKATTDYESSISTDKLDTVLNDNVELKVTEIDLFTSPKYYNRYSKADDEFVFNRLYRDPSNNIYYKLGNEYMLLKFKPNEERVLCTNTLDDDSNFWSAFFHEFNDKFKKWNVAIMHIINTANSDTVIEDEMLKAGIPRIYIESLRIYAVQRGYKIKTEDGTKLVWTFDRCEILPKTNAAKSSWRYSDLVWSFSHSLLQSVDVVRLNKIKLFSNDANEPALLHIALPVARQSDTEPVMPSTWSIFLSNDRFWNPLVDKLKIAKFVLNTLDANYSGRQTLVLSGEGQDGKGVFLDVLSNMLTEDLAVAMNVNAFDPADRFGISCILNKKLLLLTDCRSVSKLFASDKFKQITGHDKLTLEQKYAKPIMYKAENVTVAIATNTAYYVNMDHGRTRVMPVVFRKNYTKDSFIEKNVMENRLIAEKDEFLQWCADYVLWMKTRWPDVMMANAVVNCSDADLDKIQTMTDEELFVSCCQSELLNGEPCCRWNERTTDEEADAEIFAEVMDEWMDLWRISHADANYVQLTAVLPDLNIDLVGNQKLKMIFATNQVKASRSNVDYKHLIEYFKNNNNYEYYERKQIDKVQMRNVVIFTNKAQPQSDDSFYSKLII